MPTIRQTTENLKHRVEHMLHGSKESAEKPGRCTEGHPVAAGKDRCPQGHSRS